MPAERELAGEATAEGEPGSSDGNGADGRRRRRGRRGGRRNRRGRNGEELRTPSDSTVAFEGDQGHEAMEPRSDNEAPQERHEPQDTA